MKMKMAKYMMVMAVVALFLAVPAWAADEIQKSFGRKMLEGFLPLPIIFGFLYFFLRRVGRRNEPYMERATIHMDRIEKQNDEIIGLLKELTEKQRNPEHNPPRLSRVPVGHSEGEEGHSQKHHDND
jgi:hypothetical protein